MIASLRSHPSPAAPEFLRRVDSPIGRIELSGDEQAVLSLSIERDGRLPSDGIEEPRHRVLDAAADQLLEYFGDGRRVFDVPIRLRGTPFQLAIWRELQRVGWGEVVSYGHLGLATGRATAGRAVGGAVGANPLPLLVPCHRVLGSDGRITGYSAGQGVPTKSWLLDLEGIPHRAPSPRGAAVPRMAAATPPPRPLPSMAVRG